MKRLSLLALVFLAACTPTRTPSVTSTPQVVTFTPAETVPEPVSTSAPSATSELPTPTRIATPLPAVVTGGDECVKVYQDANLTARRYLSSGNPDCVVPGQPIEIYVCASGAVESCDIGDGAWIARENIQFEE